MAARVATWFAIVVGGTGGTLAALFGSGGTPALAPTSGLPLRPLGQIATQAPSGKSSPSATAAASASATNTESAAASPSASAAPGTSSTAEAPKPKAALPAAELLPLPTTKEALLRAEMHCDQRKAEACIVAARSYEGGSAGVTDADKAAKYRRIALTAWISQCDHNSAAACATLATMYRAGSGVPQSDRNADALVERARELCRFNDAPVCRELPAR
jgi:TPR repeat protein